METPNDLSTVDGLPVRISGEWAERKHHYLNNYCGITSVSMRKKFKLVYVDVMAGPGRCKIEKTNKEFPGSPLVALNHDFAEYIFIEENPQLADALTKRIASHPKTKKVTILSENWIKALEAQQLEFDNSTLAVVFVDPIGISEVPMSAMKKLANNPRIDLLVTIQYRLGIVRNLPQYLKSKSNQTALDNFLGDQSWREWKIGALENSAAGPSNISAINSRTTRDSSARVTFQFQNKIHCIVSPCSAGIRGRRIFGTKY